MGGTAMMTFGEKLRAYVKATARGLRVPAACYFVAMVLSDRFAFPMANTAMALLLSVWAYEDVMFKEEE